VLLMISAKGILKPPTRLWCCGAMLLPQEMLKTLT